ncbi:disulfide bond formation protein DsbB [Rheinheimera sp.]|uniref:disulfide bond formation protein DsbB n=1 Tax=Rheinheimera sp. TaxID=1869214 RepID=UPI0027BA25ED|nr:disulfide bond formation protein DsbB [Rheinheimera sp.]
MFAAVARWPKQRWPWVLLAVSAIALMLVALFFQYGMALAPCIMCVYQRFAITGIFFAGVIGLWGRESAPVRWLAYSSWAVSAGWGLKIAHDQVLVEEVVKSGGFSSCGLFAEFPTWLPLDQWLPAIFNPTGVCGEIAWQFLGYSMPFWMRIIFAVYLGLALIVMASQLKKHKYNPYD